ncbi:MAG: hypothetical protein ABH821_02520 [archaeon]
MNWRKIIEKHQKKGQTIMDCLTRYYLKNDNNNARRQGNPAESSNEPILQIMSELYEITPEDYKEIQAKDTALKKQKRKLPKILKKGITQLLQLEDNQKFLGTSVKKLFLLYFLHGFNSSNSFRVNARNN